MKKVGIDGRLIAQTGVGVYIKNLLHYLPSFVPKDWSIYVYLKRKDFDAVDIPSGVKKVVADFQWHSLSEQIGFLSLLNREKLDLMHFTYFSYPIWYKKPFVSTVHDLTPLTHKTGKASTKNATTYELKYLGLKVTLSNLSKNARAILVPTNSVKQEIITYFGNKVKDKIYVTHEGVDHTLFTLQENVLLKKKFHKDFLVYIGNFYPHKNVERLIEAFTKVHQDIQLILVGPDDYFSKLILRSIDRSKSSGRIILYKNATREDLVFFYKNARALVHPSLAEGFGLTLIEASFFGLPIIASDIEVFNEVFDKQFIPFNPMDPDDIAKKITSFLEKKPQFDYKKILDTYSFEKMTKETVEVYKQIVNQ